MRLFYSVSDTFPAFRVDISELFGVELPKLGLEVEWFMMGPADGRPSVFGQAQPVHLPLRLPGRWPGRGLVNRLLAWACDAGQVVRAALRRDIDAVQCRDKFFVALVAALACRLLGKPFFYWCSYPYPEHHQLEGRRRGGLRGQLQYIKGSAEFWLLYKVIMPLASHVFVQSDQMLRDIHATGLPVARMTPVPMGVPLRLLDWARAQCTAVVPGRIVYVGTLGAVRRLQVLIESFALVAARDPQATLVVVGDGDFPHERAGLEALASQVGLQDRVTFTGFVPMEQAWLWAASAAVCLSPFYPTPVLRSASPTKLVEYLALSRPVVCNDHPEQSAIVRACGAGVCVAWSAQAFAQAILQILGDPGQFEDGVQPGRQWVAQHRSYPAIAADVMAVYRRHLGDAA